VLVIAASVMIPLTVQGRLRFVSFVLAFLALLPLAVSMFRAIHRNGLLAPNPAACWGSEDPNAQSEWVALSADPDLANAWATKSGDRA
jgi:branched-subunit amino acid transport protein